MNLLAIVVLCVMVILVIGIDKREVESIENIEKNEYYQKNKNKLNNIIYNIKNNLCNMYVPIDSIYEYDFKNINEDEYYLIIDKSKKDSIKICNNTDIIIFNFVKNGEKTAAFDSKYVYSNKSELKISRAKLFFAKYTILAMNYIHFFIKKDIKFSEVILIKGENLKKIASLGRKDIVFFGPSDIIIERQENIKKLNKNVIKSEYGIINFFVAALSILIGTVVMSNLWYNIFRFIFNISVMALKELIYAVLIYYCHLGINNVIYKPIGKLKTIASIFFYVFCFETILLNFKDLFRGTKDNMKNGISLTILIITIVVLSALTGVTIALTRNELDSVELTKFIEDLEILGEAVDYYYISNGNMPITNDVYNKTTLVALLSDSVSISKLSQQIERNGDNDDEFYKIDMSLLPVSDTNKGLGLTRADIFVIDEDLKTIYYVAGKKIKDEQYFCIDQTRLPENLDTANNKNTEISIVSSTTSIKLTKNETNYVTSLIVGISTTLEADESLQYTIGGETLALTDAITAINMPADVLSAISSSNIAMFKTTFNSNKKITVNKIKGGQVVATSTMSLENIKDLK